VQRYACGVAYDGAQFSGWQLQGHGRPTVQGAVEAALSAVADHPVRVFCAGRTDSGVSASAQVIHFDSPAARSTSNWLRGANAHLSGSVALQWVRVVDDAFHARFSARLRRYWYLLYPADIRSPLLRKGITWYRGDLDVSRMHAAAQDLLGEQDFSVFRAAGCQSSTPMRCVTDVAVRSVSALVVIDIAANAFLHHMVRNIAGALVGIGSGELPADAVATLLASRDRRLAPPTAPPDGLHLTQVCYRGYPDIPQGVIAPPFLPLAD
jgi:tRNA pseudouridine38-40 synthase